jgi:hypothetical protein
VKPRNPWRTSRRDWCRSCHEWRYIKARHLCETCWIYAKKTGNLDQYPTKAEEREDGFTCKCFQPSAERIAVFDVWQCRKCGRKLVV